MVALEQILCGIVLLPALGALLCGLLGRRLGDKTHFIAIGAASGSFLLVCYATWQFLTHHLYSLQSDFPLYDWIASGTLTIKVGWLLDSLTIVMLCVVTGVGLLIHIYSVGYMHGDPGYSRFFAYLNLFLFFMLVLVLANSYPLMFVGWEGVGLCSYLLIGFWFTKDSASNAAKKAFLVNRIGDAAFLIGMFLIFVTCGSLNYLEVFRAAPAISTGLITAVTLCLFIGACGKSAQIPLYVWLPDAMEGPTPVSALIHAATMVTAGVYMVARNHILYTAAPFTMQVVATVGACTALFAATIAITQTDIKKVLAYSTISQLGYMFLACGVGAFGAGIFHLGTHAFFKGLLFLGSGSVIHAMSGEQNMQQMGALRKHIPITAVTFYIATLAIAGIPPFAGFWSKDEILAQAFHSGNYFLWGIGVITAGLTAFYMFRLIYLTFYGASRVGAEAKHHLHESPLTMTGPLMMLALLSAGAGVLLGFPPESGWLHHFLAPAVSAHAEALRHVHHEVLWFGLTPLNWLLMSLSVAVGLIGWFSARFLYVTRADLPRRLAEKWQSVYQLLFNKYWIDELYGKLFVQPYLWLANLSWTVDAKGVDGLVNGVGALALFKSAVANWTDKHIVDGAANGIADTMQSGARRFRKLQTGMFQNYALAMALGVCVVAVAGILLIPFMTR